ncbi:MAG TPA: sodium:calcium antiporter, partial [Afifellaceae bacterium]|nr:sodium:calcium antiporter [Afifellaceae bacterium]
YRPGPLLAQADRSAVFAIASGIVVTIIYVIGLVIRSRRTVGGLGIDSMLVMAVYLATIAGLYILR